jgi:hypothetical protein
MRLEALELFGNVCASCGYDDPRALCFDHIADDGNEHRTKVRVLPAQWIISNPEEAIDRLQVLCANCNLIKEIERRASVSFVSREERRGLASFVSPPRPTGVVALTPASIGQDDSSSCATRQ